MSKFSGLDLGSLVAVSTGTAVETAQFEKLVAAVSGTFVGTVIIESSPDGTNFAAAPGSSSFTAPGSIEITVPCKQLRARCSAFTSGTIVCKAGGRDEDVLG